MCRLAAYAGTPWSPRELVFGGSHSLYEQSYAPTELISGSVNADGWGVLWYAEDGPVRLRRAAPIWFEEDLERLLSTVQAECALAAVRNTTTGIPSDPSGVPPLLFGRWSFVLNGFIGSFRRSAMRHLHDLLPEDLYAELHGTSDTEALFLLAISRLRKGASVADALRWTVAEALEAAERAGADAYLNLMLSDGETVVCTRTSSTRISNSLYVASGSALAPQGVLIASERLDEDSTWEEIPGNSMVVASAADCAVVSLD